VNRRITRIKLDSGGGLFRKAEIGERIGSFLDESGRKKYKHSGNRKKKGTWRGDRGPKEAMAKVEIRKEGCEINSRRRTKKTKRRGRCPNRVEYRR